jgi:hypothetical protein
MERVKVAVRLLELSLPELGAASPQGKAVMKAISSLSKEVGQGAGGGTEARELQNLMLNARQQQPMMELLRAQGGGAAPAAGAAPGAAGGMPAMPSPPATGA